MSLLNKFKTNSYCVGGRQYSGTNNISGAITSKGTKEDLALNVKGINQ